MWQIYHNEQCSKSRGAVEYLNDKKIDYTMINYLETPLTVEMITDLLTKLGVGIDGVIRTNEDAFKAVEGEWFTYSKAQKLAYVIKHPIVLQRPIIVHNERAVIGRPDATEIDKIL